MVYKGLDVRGLLLEEAGERHKRSRDEGESDGDMTLYVFREEEDFKVVKQPSSHFPAKKNTSKQTKMCYNLDVSFLQSFSQMPLKIWENKKNSF